jgi:4-diphosphocytidyl-2-C-methyl-D-erythritol kinase
VTGRRPDGYHLLDAEMVSIDLVDELTFADATDASSLEIVGASDGADDGVDASAGLPTDERNLVLKALRAVNRHAHVRLLKRIPPGGGLGGGSSNAAAVLRWAGSHDLRLAASLGADVPFCLQGGRARVHGIGEELTLLPYEPRTYTLLTPPFGCSTPAVYRAWDDLGDPTATAVNDLQAAALSVEPRLAQWRDELRQATGQEPVLAGSGSTWFVEGDYPGDSRIVVHTLPGDG